MGALSGDAADDLHTEGKGCIKLCNSNKPDLWQEEVSHDPTGAVCEVDLCRMEHLIIFYVNRKKTGTLDTIRKKITKKCLTVQ